MQFRSVLLAVDTQHLIKHDHHTQLLSTIRTARLVGLPIEGIPDAKPLAASTTLDMRRKVRSKEIMEVVDNNINSEKLITDFFKSARVNGG